VKKKNPNKTVGYAFVGRWKSPANMLGWAMPNFISPHTGKKRRAERIRDATAKGWGFKDDMLTLCKITIEVAKDKNGREIRRRLHPKRNEQ